jgi:elongation factor P
MGEFSTNDLRPGAKVEVDNEPYVVVSNEFVKPGKGQAFNRIKLKSILTSRVMEKTYKSGEKFKEADVLEASMRLLYVDGDNAVFMDDTTFDQVNVPVSVVKDAKKWLKDDTMYEIIFYKGEVVEVMPPTFMQLKITQTSPGIRGDTSGRVLKPAVVETGANIQIPIFIEEGEIIKVDTRSTAYVSRA